MTDYRPALLFALVMTGYVEYKWWNHRKEREAIMAQHAREIGAIMKKYKQ